MTQKAGALESGGWQRMALLAGALGLALAGCAATPDADSDAVAASDAGVQEVGSGDRITLGSNETYQPPLPAADNAMPEYPAALLERALPEQVVCVQASISEQGQVTGTMPVSDIDGCPPPATAFYDAAVAAVSSWRFEPAFRCIYQNADDVTPYGCIGEDAREQPLAVRLNYRFTFEQSDGQGQVTVTGG